MKQSFRFTFIAIALIGAYVLSACGGGLPQPIPSDVAQKVQAKEIVFTGIVEQINGNEWVVSGQTFILDPSAVMDSGIAIGDIVKVEGTVSVDGSVVAFKVESSAVTDDNSNTANANDNNSNGNVNANDDNSNDDDRNNNDADDSEVFGVVEAITADSITIGGVTYFLADFTEFKDAISIGDQVKIHVIVNSDGTFTIREIEKSDAQGGDDNSNSGNGNDDNSNDDDGNSNSNDDNSNDDSGHGGGNDNDDDDDDDNGNDD